VRLLLDTHALLWAVDNPARLASTARSEITNPANSRFVSAVTIWEIAIKAGLNKLSLSLPFRQWVDRAFHQLVADLLPITLDHAGAYLHLPHHHGDPFDRMLAAQSLADSLTVVSADAVFDLYGVPRLWH
jgi:PIN domain nuclease of toxin-antitoxin system